MAGSLIGLAILLGAFYSGTPSERAIAWAADTPRIAVWLIWTAVYARWYASFQDMRRWKKVGGEKVIFSPSGFIALSLLFVIMYGSLTYSIFVGSGSHIAIIAATSATLTLAGAVSLNRRFLFVILGLCSFVWLIFGFTLFLADSEASFLRLPVGASLSTMFRFSELVAFGIALALVVFATAVLVTSALFSVAAMSLTMRRRHGL